MTHVRKALILDANILIRAALGPKVRNLILDNRDKGRFFTPIQCVKDAKKYLPAILSSKGVDPATAMDVLNLILNEVVILDSEWLCDNESISRSRLKNRDINDWPVLAASLSLSCPIWTQDMDFFGLGVATWTTEHISDYFDMDLPQ